MDKKKFEEAEVEVILLNADIKTAGLPITSEEDDDSRQ